MPITIRFDKNAPTASAEFMIDNRLADYGLKEIEAPASGPMEFVLASEKFRQLIHDARRIVDRQLEGSNLEIVQLEGTICHDVNVYRLGIRLVVRERGRDGDLSEAARERFTSIAETVRETLKLS